MDHLKRSRKFTVEFTMKVLLWKQLRVHLNSQGIGDKNNIKHIQRNFNERGPDSKSSRPRDRKTDIEV